MVLWPSSPSVGETYEEGGITYTCVQASPAKWRTASGLGPAVITTQYTTADTHTVADGTRYATVFAWGSTDAGAPFAQTYTANELGATAAIVIGDGAGSPTDTTFNPAGTGSTLTATGATGDTGKLIITEYLGESYGTTSRSNIGEVFWWPGAAATVPQNALVCDGSTHNDADYPLFIAKMTELSLYVASAQNGWEVLDNGDGTFDMPDICTANRFIRAADGTTIDAGDVAADGAPNITGYVNSPTPARATDTLTKGGAFTDTTTEDRSVATSAGTNFGFKRLNFDASDDDATYSDSNTEIVPVNIAAVPCMRVS